MKALERQREIYLNGLAGKKPLIPTGFDKLEAAAKAAMGSRAYAYVAGGAGMGKTMLENRKSLDSVKLKPSMLKDVELRDTTIELFGDILPSPLLLAPVGVLDLAHQNAELAVARAAAKNNIPMIFSNQASEPMEACANEMGTSPRWFQLYWSKIDELVFSFIQRAEQCGCSAIVVTLDTTMLGWRTQDLDLAYLPFLYGRGIAQYITDPVFMKSLDDVIPNERDSINWNLLKAAFMAAQKVPGGTIKNLLSGKSVKAVQQFVSTYSRPNLAWKEIELLVKKTKLPVLLKGIQCGDDALKAVDAGVSGIVVSNHGGRQVDGAVGSFEMLRKIAPLVNEKIKVLFDSGIRGGADVVKALAAGAHACLVGRPYVYALALAGEEGVEELLKNYMAEIELTMGLCGLKSIADINEGLIL